MNYHNSTKICPAVLPITLSSTHMISSPLDPNQPSSLSRSNLSPAATSVSSRLAK